MKVDVSAGTHATLRRLADDLGVNVKDVVDALVAREAATLALSADQVLAVKHALERELRRFRANLRRGAA